MGGTDGTWASWTLGQWGMGLMDPIIHCSFVCAQLPLDEGISLYSLGECRVANLPPASKAEGQRKDVYASLPVPSGVKTTSSM